MQYNLRHLVWNTSSKLHHIGVAHTDFAILVKSDVPFVFWRMRNTADPIRHRIRSSCNLKCDLFTRAHSIAYARVRIVPDKSQRANVP